MTTQSAPAPSETTPWWTQAKENAGFIIQRLIQRNLTQIASSLTFTTILAIVPLLAVVLALFTAFPLFNEFRDALQGFLTTNLMPEVVSENIMDYLNDFAAKASSLTAIGSLFLIVTSIMLLSTIDQTFNDIWLVTEKRPIAQRILVYWAIVSLGPILGGASLWASSVLATESMGYIGDLSAVVSFSLALFPFLVTILAFTALFVYVPNRKVRWGDALAGALATTIALEILKRGFAFYITQFPTYTLIYGAFAIVPIFLMWIYLSWLVVLLGASLAAILPSLRHRKWTSTHYAGAPFINAISMLSLLWQKRSQAPIGLTLPQISQALKRDAAELNPLLSTLKEGNYVVNTLEKDEERWVLACDPAITPLAPLVDSLCIDRQQANSTTTQSIMALISATLAHPAMNLKTLLENPDKLMAFGEQLQQQTQDAIQHIGESTHAKS